MKKGQEDWHQQAVLQWGKLVNLSSKEDNTASGRFLKISEIVFQWPFSDLEKFYRHNSKRVVWYESVKDGLQQQAGPETLRGTVNIIRGVVTSKYLLRYRQRKGTEMLHFCIGSWRYRVSSGQVDKWYWKNIEFWILKKIKISQTQCGQNIFCLLCLTLLQTSKLEITDARAAQLMKAGLCWRSLPADREPQVRGNLICENTLWYHFWSQLLPWLDMSSFFFPLCLTEVHQIHLVAFKIIAAGIEYLSLL